MVNETPRLAALPEAFLPRAGSPLVAWRISDEPVAYAAALAWMEARAERIGRGQAPECVWLLEHPALYSAGTSARDADLVAPARFPVYRTGRGGQYTYHGPGQRVAYVMLDLNRRRADLRAYVAALEAWIIATLAAFNVVAERREDRVGVWVRRPEKGLVNGRAAEDKIAAIGIRVRRWVSFHGISLNVDPDLSHFSGIVPCGIRGHGVTSLADLGRLVSPEEVDMQLRAAFTPIFGTATDEP
ncbi:lipoyl(octanoyl) transferase LipB [uncultured Methylobacterium sp.]|uniref:lipoyl(octanoyl) transferase LipB n=1 Tax=uncultured Methylobacterium sp. TaxID=157278 RepID=UPI0035C97A09